MSRHLAALVAPALLVALSLGADDGTFKPLVEGTDPEQFRLVEIGPDTLKITEDGEIHVSGNPNGYFATKQSYKDYELRFQFQFERPDGLESDEDFKGNSGVLLHIEEPHKVWPRSIEFQLMNPEVGKIYRIGGSKLDGEWDRDRYRSAIRPVGQWNRMTVRSQGGRMSCILNDVMVTEGKNAEPAEGPIGWQSEGVPIRFRGLEIMELD